MTLDELNHSIKSAKWFINLGRFQGRKGFVALKSLKAWDQTDQSRHEDFAMEDAMQWLPSSRDEHDPIYQNSLKELLLQKNKQEEGRRTGVEIYKQVLSSLRNAVKHPLLFVGPHDFTEAAKGAALYAFRSASLEILAERQGFWCSLIPLYCEGYWPCGLLPSGEIVVL